MHTVKAKSFEETLHSAQNAAVDLLFSPLKLLDKVVNLILSCPPFLTGSSLH